MNSVPINFPISRLQDTSFLGKIDVGADALIESGKHYFVQLSVDDVPTDLFVKVLEKTARIIEVQILKTRDYIKATDVPDGHTVIANVDGRGVISDFRVVKDSDGSTRSGPEAERYRDSFMTKPEYYHYNIDHYVNMLEELDNVTEVQLAAKLVELERHYGHVDASLTNDEKLEEYKRIIQGFIDKQKELWKSSEFVRDEAGNPIPGQWVDHEGGPWPIPIRDISENPVYGYLFYRPKLESAPAAGGRRSTRRRRTRHRRRRNTRTRTF